MAGAGSSASGSTQYDIAIGTTGGKNAESVSGNNMQEVRTTVTVDANTGSGTDGAVVSLDEINLFLLPPGKVTLHLRNCVRKISADQGALTVFDIGYRAHIKNDGTVVVVDPNAIVVLASADETTIELWSADGLGTPADSAYAADVTDWNSITFDSKDGVTLFMTTGAAGTWDGDIGDTYKFSIFISKPGG